VMARRAMHESAQGSQQMGSAIASTHDSFKVLDIDSTWVGAVVADTITLAVPSHVSNILLTMARFQALTNNVLDAELEMLRKRLGLDRSQKAELLREVAGLAAWVVRQAEQGREIQARDGQNVERGRTTDCRARASVQPAGASVDTQNRPVMDTAKPAR
jgi:hypothetical protein